MVLPPPASVGSTQLKRDAATPYMRHQWGPAFDQLARIKRALDPNNIMGPGKLGF